MSATTEIVTIPRSCLVVPGHKSRMHEKAAAAGADEVVFDLEDAVPPADKDAAREIVLAALADPAWRERRVAVRVNAPGTAAHFADIAAVAGSDHPALSVVVPKVEDPGQIQVVIARLGRLRPVQALIESLRGLLDAAAIAAQPGVAALIIGYADLAAELGRRPAIDGPFFGLRDARGLAAAAVTARAAGFDGKWAIHPDQVAVINAAFAPTSAELEWADGVLSALDDEGAASVGGAMVDEAMARRARRLLTLGTPDDNGRGEEASSAVRRVGAPYYDDLSTGDVFAGPGVTITPGHAALHQAIVGDRLRLALDAPLAEAVTGQPGVLAHPMLVCDLAIGQSTTPSGRVLGNLFYRGLGCRRVHVGATLRTRTEVVARRDASGGRGIVALRVTSTDQTGIPVLDFWRCPLLPASDGAGPVGATDDSQLSGRPPTRTTTFPNVGLSHRCATSRSGRSSLSSVSATASRWRPARRSPPHRNSRASRSTWR